MLTPESQRSATDGGDPQIRCKTRGGAAFLETVTRLEEGAAAPRNFAGTAVDPKAAASGGGWTDKLVNVGKSADPPTKLKQDQVEGVDEEEWND